MSLSRLAYYLEKRPFLGRLPEPDAIGVANMDGRPPGAAMYLKVREGRIADAGYQASGCGYLVACCSAILELAVGQTIQTSEQLNEAHLITHIGELPEHRHYCAELAVRALKNTLAQLASLDSAESEEVT